MSNRALQRMIHVACRELRLDQDTRRDLQAQVTGKASMAEMTDAELEAVIAALKAKGFTAQVSHGKGGKARPAARRADLRYAHVLWGLLGKAGALEKPGRAGLNAFMRKSFGAKWGAVPLDIDMLDDTAQIRDVTEALKAWCRRLGIAVTK